MLIEIVNMDEVGPFRCVVFLNVDYEGSIVNFLKHRVFLFFKRFFVRPRFQEW